MNGFNKRSVVKRKQGFNHSRKTFFCIVLSVLLLSVTVLTQKKTEFLEWPQFRGPNGSGVRETTGLPSEFGPDQNVIWKRALPTGHSSPIPIENYIFLTACEEEKLLTICLNRKNGDILWRREAPRPRKEKLDFRNNPASPSPVTDGQHVYVFFPDFGLLGYDFDGKELWRLPLSPFDNMYGMGASPVLAEDKVILVCDQNTGSFIIAVDKNDGKVSWKIDRPEAKSGHSTPVVYSPEGGETQILVPGSFLLISYSVRNGDRLWWTGGLSFEMKSTPVISNGVVFINGYASPLMYKNIFYMIDDVGFMTSLKPENGELIKEGRLRGAGSKFFASPVAADDKIFIVSLRGKICVLKPDGSLERVALSDLKEECYATPAIGEGRIYIRTVNTLYCFGLDE